MKNTGPLLTALAYTAGTDLTKTARCIDVLTSGVVEWIDREGSTISYTFSTFDAAGGDFSTFPYRIEDVSVRQITANTTATIQLYH